LGYFYFRVLSSVGLAGATHERASAG
jgi:hypothetical protein